MKKSSLLMIIGIIVLVTPFLGFPNALQVSVFVIVGLVLFVEGYRTRVKRINNFPADSFVQNERPSESQTPRV